MNPILTMATSIGAAIVISIAAIWFKRWFASEVIEGPRLDRENRDKP